MRAHVHIVAASALALALAVLTVIPPHGTTTATPAQATRPAGSVPTPELHCGTPTPGVRPTDPAFFPNLVARGMAICFRPCVRCSRPGESRGVVVDVGNAGITSSGPFLVEVNGALQAVGETQPGKFVNLFFPGYRPAENTLLVDPLDQVYEVGKEDDNALRGVLPTPDCPAIPVCTPGPTPGLVPDLTVRALRIELRPRWQCGDPTTLGLTIEIANQYAPATGPFVVTGNETPVAHDSVPPLATAVLWVPGYRTGAEQSVELDSANQVGEADESNNTRHEMVPVPTLPPCPSATMTPTLPPSATASPTATGIRPTVTATATAVGPPTPGAIQLPLVFVGR